MIRRHHCEDREGAKHGPLQEHFGTCLLFKMRFTLVQICTSLLSGKPNSSLTCSFLLPVATKSLPPDPTERSSSDMILRLTQSLLRTSFQPLPADALSGTPQSPSWEPNDCIMYSPGRNDWGSRCPCTCRLTKSRRLPKDLFHVASRQLLLCPNLTPRLRSSRRHP